MEPTESKESDLLPEHCPDEAASEQMLEAVYHAMDEIATNLDLCSLQDSILEIILRAIHAQRGAILFADEMPTRLAPCPNCHTIHLIQNGEMQRVCLDAVSIHHSVTARVLEGGESILYQESASLSESAAKLGVESVLCVPLRTKSSILGLLYVNTNQANLEYNEVHLHLCSAVGARAGLAIENAQRHADVLSKQRIEQEIAHAWTIQQGFLIKNWTQTDSRFDAYGEMRPAEVVGGDFYDRVFPDQNTVGFLVGDVSGKGISAALTMAQVLAQFRAIALHESSPVRVLACLNRDMCLRSQQGTFCTACYLMLNLVNGQIRCANAGHPSPLQISESGVTSFGAASGPPLGIIPSGTWQETEWRIDSGDSILIYTDGILEARCGTLRDASGMPDELGLEGICRVAQRMHGKSSRALVEAVTAAVVAHCIPDTPHDDCTSIAVRYLKNGQKSAY